MTFEVGRLFEIGRQSADHRTPADRFQRTSLDDLPTIIGDIGRFHTRLGDTPSRQFVDRCPADVRAGINLSMVLRLKKSGGHQKMFN